MGWRWRLGEFFGIVVYVHATFLLLVGWVAFTSYDETHNWGQTLAGILFILLVFVCVVMHEYGHALTARRYGIRTQDITLLPIGGVARLERMPREPSQELWVALAGPAVNVGIAVFLYLLMRIVAGASGPISIPRVGGGLLQMLLWVNVVMVLFNLLPAFPMDGGRVLRALLAHRLDYAQATRIAANIGQMMAFAFGLWGLFRGHPFLLFIALFVYIGAEAEAQMVQVQSTISGVPVRAAMVTRFATLRADETLGDAVRVLLSGTQQDFPVVDDGRVVGLLTRRDLLAALPEQGRTAPIADAMHHTLEPVGAHAPLDDTYQRMQAEELPALPVMEAGQLVGLLTMENIAEFLLVRTAIRSGRAARNRETISHV
jgi:Zn-dependent protease